MREQLESRGFVIVPQLLDDLCLSELQRATAHLDSVGLRNLCAKVPAVRSFAASAVVRALIESLFGCNARLVRAIFFNKEPGRNWHVPWHQDTTIAVAARHEVDGFGAWSVKEAVPHVQAPLWLLRQMLTLRLHLDPADADNGALWVAPGSHRLGQIRDETAVLNQCGIHVCAGAAGSALLMRPLLLHASRKSTVARPRRVIHLEFAVADALPPPLEWAEGAAQGDC